MKAPSAAPGNQASQGQAVQEGPDARPMWIDSDLSTFGFVVKVLKGSYGFGERKSLD